MRTQMLSVHFCRSKITLLRRRKRFRPASMQDRSRIRKGMVAAVTGVDSAADMETEEVPAVDAGVTEVDTVDIIKIKGFSEVGVVVATEEAEGAATTAAEAAMEEDTAEAVEEETRTKHR